MRPGNLVRRGAALAALLILIGCRRPAALRGGGLGVRVPASHPSTPNLTTYRNDSLDVELSYPAAWVVKPSEDFVWMAAPTKGASSSAMIALEVPSLPPHVPGWIPLNLVRNGYVNDLKEGKANFSHTETTQVIPGTKAACLVKSVWLENGIPFFENALIVIHANRVYIIHGEGNGGDQYLVAPTFDAVTASLHWLK